ncbi:FecR family protein [Chitinophaga lutea]|uniref:FecR family protein n=1 Tax=Chitinophaga lutea TaxID=2488634 RepID=UPI0013159C35|nr:FecR family protein [Chitinophaga lutea]
MNQPETYLHELLAKAHWTDEECRWLLHYLDHTPGTALQTHLLERFRQQGFEPQHQQLSDGILARIHARIQPAAPVTPVMPMYRRWWNIAAAAVLVGAAVAGGIYWLRPVANVQTAGVQALPAVTDVAPGGNKARLVLGNGQAVLLDQAADGPIAGSGEQVHKQDAELVYGPGGGSGSNTLITPNGGQFRVQLADGTKVWLNAASSLQYPAAFTGSDRTVTLKGEAYFEVAQNADKPFFVNVNGMTVQVLGTHFNVNAYAEEKHFTTTLLEGAVRVVAGNQRLTLAPGQQTTLEQHSGVLQRSAGDTENAVAWKNGLFTFKNDELVAVMRDISRWYDVSVVFEDGADEKIHVTGAMRRQEYLQQALKILELTADLHFEVQGRTVTVRKK